MGGDLYLDPFKGRSIGEGSFGTVYKGLLRSETVVAVKTMRVSKVTKDVVSKHVATLSHPHLD